VELSAKVLANWVAKAANLLQDDLDAAPATTVGLDLPAHWRAFYWALAAWSVGATVIVGDGAGMADVVVTADPESAATVAEAAGLTVLVTLPMLARGNPEAAVDVVDEARSLAGFGDVFTPWEVPGPKLAALASSSSTHTYADVVTSRPDWGREPRLRIPDDLTRALPAALSAWAADGSVVLVRQAVGDQSGRLAPERISIDLS
jgi:uncharacterized protein (TIGR03089 family)